MKTISTTITMASAVLATWLGCASGVGESDEPPTPQQAEGGHAASSAGGAGGAGGSGAGSVTTDPECSGAMQGVVRDFRYNHPDFETFGGLKATTGLVLSQLGPDGKPVYAHPGPTNQTTGPAEFAQWYRDASVNRAVPITLNLVEVDGVLIYDNPSFFPIDDDGFGDEGFAHNFHFTTEIHTFFTYQGGEHFTFIGDDDLWLFINGRLAIDLGGLHEALEATVDLDAMALSLGITPGSDYPMDIFHAERHTSKSNFRVETTIACFQPPPL